MKFLEEKLIEKGMGKYTVTVEGEEWAETLKKAKKRLSASVVVPGFRKGKAPQSKIEQYLTMPRVLREAASVILDPTWKFALDSKKDVEPFSQPKPSVTDLSETNCKIEFDFDLKPEITVGKYTGIKPKDAKKEKVEATEEEINNSIDQYRERLVMEKDRKDDEAIKKGDSVVFDFEGFVDGKAFNGGKGLDFTLIIGKNQMIPGFEDAMVGLKKGESTIKVKFPKDYTPELSEKDAEFKLNIKSIKERILPKVDDEFVKDLSLTKISTVDEFKKDIKNRIIEQKTANSKNAFVSEVIKEIAKESKFVIPKSAILEQVNKLYQEFQQELAAKKVTLEQYKKNSGLNEDQIKDELFDDAKARVESYLVTDAVRNNEKFEVKEEQLVKKFDELAKSFNMESKDIRNKLLSDDQVKEEIIRENIINFIYENNG